MFAIIEDGAHQYKVKVGQKLEVEKKEAEEGKSFSFKQVLLISDNGKTDIGMPYLAATVDAKVLEHGRGDKIRVVKKKSKKRFAKMQGHRQSYTKIEITNISSGSKSSKSSIRAAKPAAEKKPAKKIAAKKTVAKKAPAKKTVAKK